MNIKASSISTQMSIALETSDCSGRSYRYKLNITLVATQYLDFFKS